jgi:tRNA(Ile2) C34 agmatinyltransferase TiaS
MAGRADEDERMKQVMSGMLEKLEKRALADKIEFGSGDVCAQCSNTFVGWGQCRKCGYKMDHPEQCRNCMNVAPGVCGPCVDRGAPACRCEVKTDVIRIETNTVRGGK